MAVVKRNKSKSVDVDESENKYSKGVEKVEFIGQRWLSQPLPDAEPTYNTWMYIVTTIAFITRFYKIWNPKEVVFDEVHFGKFASYYLERTYFFDVHPPFAKMMIAFIGFLVGYDGSFKFEEIGMPYDKNPAPYIAYRSFNALLGTLTVPIMFLTLKELNFKAITCAFAALLVAVDNAHVTETRLILLDAILIISIAASLCCYVRFYKEQLKAPFSTSWYIWLYATGLSLSFVISTKYVGVMTYVAIGIPVIVNLWQLLDIRTGLTLHTFARHFLRRLNGLVFAPFIVYLFWFWCHFSILINSGPGDAFMSQDFQETLNESALAKEAKQINYFDIVTFKHKDTEAYLHSHLLNYPLRYEDGRVSSNGQQVTGYVHEDKNNEWEILPVKELKSKIGQPVLQGEQIRLRHVSTDTYLLTHDVASPLYPTNEEVTTVSEEDANGERYQQTLFTLQPVNKKDNGRKIKSKMTSFRIFHVDTAVALWTHNDELLPDWGKSQQEVNGNKKVTSSENTWLVETIVNLDEARKIYYPKVIKTLPFISKWLEAQRLMFEHNNKLSSEHPFASEPYTWPGSLNGVSFWTDDEKKLQIFFIGNIIGWWFQVISLAVFVGLVCADLITRQRGYYALNEITREKIYGPLLFFFIGWCCHYFPFFLMGRQKFLHHYLPAHLIAALFSAALWEVIFSNTKTEDPSKDDKDAAYNTTAVVIHDKQLSLFFLIVSVAVVGFFIYFAPLVYGDISLTPEQVQSRKWFNLKLHFAK
ncbi:hypothetical protein TPHA_0B00290 [Tetrapisispora phaffii CBS 4417]|uniref:Dolichyl-phosphate-mannose--protein mannosyltransferase n=1 Tax=Tetrapisispora phaffii (strain ATCC 24235 / CBS 4417 / NBRC 1672 / NRRL Y-8282 / UCD 70-5) TaxID=1071381 RepID=G8BQA4_TETPH|nr:hypothetical protein TPHA_0B00290 [Tetrapisispora phaffii CBS 4417]CCE61701.1 hypothetical protein TPHA_0B00290 [Tetrapisispora phaffii CBS 4417]